MIKLWGREGDDKQNACLIKLIRKIRYDSTKNISFFE